MMGRRHFAQKLHYQLSLDQLVPQDHVLRRVAETVDFSFVRPLCRPFYSHTRRPSVDPVALFKMLLALPHDHLGNSPYWTSTRTLPGTAAYGIMQLEGSEPAAGKAVGFAALSI